MLNRQALIILGTDLQNESLILSRRETAEVAISRIWHQLADIAETVVAAAEQLYHATDPDGEVRRKYAHHLIAVAAGRLGLALTDKEIDSMLQAAVQELNLMKYGYIAEAKEDGES